MQAFEKSETLAEPGWRLSPEEMRRYRQDGLVRPDLSFAPSELAEVQTLLDVTLAATEGRRPESIVCPPHRSDERPVTQPRERLAAALHLAPAS